MSYMALVLAKTLITLLYVTAAAGTAEADAWRTA